MGQITCSDYLISDLQGHKTGNHAMGNGCHLPLISPQIYGWCDIMVIPHEIAKGEFVPELRLIIQSQQDIIVHRF